MEFTRNNTTGRRILVTARSSLGSSPGPRSCSVSAGTDTECTITGLSNNNVYKVNAGADTGHCTSSQRGSDLRTRNSDDQRCWAVTNHYDVDLPRAVPGSPTITRAHSALSSAVVAGDGLLLVSFEPADLIPNRSFEIESCPSSNTTASTCAAQGDQLVECEMPVCKLRGLTNGDAFKFVIRAKDSMGDSDDTFRASSGTPTSLTPSAPPASMWSVRATGRNAVEVSFKTAHVPASWACWYESANGELWGGVEPKYYDADQAGRTCREVGVLTSAEFASSNLHRVSNDGFTARRRVNGTTGAWTETSYDRKIDGRPSSGSFRLTGLTTGTTYEVQLRVNKGSPSVAANRGTWSASQTVTTR